MTGSEKRSSSFARRAKARRARRSFLSTSSTRRRRKARSNVKLCPCCGRKFCRCGEHVSNRPCSRHGAMLKIISFAQVSPRGTFWFEAAKCTVPGCKTVRNLNKDRQAPTFGASPLILKMQKKFKAEEIGRASCRERG